MPLLALHDSSEQLRQQGSFPVSRPQAEELNREGYGIFWTPNLYRGRRLVANLEAIRYWFAEIDGVPKKEQAQRLRRAPLLPSVVVESANSYQAYWRARDATPENWKRIVRWGIVPMLGADVKATDAVRILRAPGFNHLKDPARPFPVRTVWKLDTAYTEAQMLRLFPNRQPQQPVQERVALEPGTGKFWQRVAALDGREAITRLSGHLLCKGERFRLAEQPNGNANIIREWPDGPRDTGSFIDAAGRLGSVEGGSSIAAWVNWYQHDWNAVAEGLRGVFPELGTERDE